MRYFVRTTGSRKFNYDLDYELLVDKNHKPVESFIEQLRRISSEDCVLLEDDLVLCKNFKEEIEKVIQKYPDKIINFFTDPMIYFETHIHGRFNYNQCTYYPKGIAKKIADEMEKELLKSPGEGYDVLEDKALLNLGLTHIRYRPCLVQHKDNSSLIWAVKLGGRVTPYFKDWLDELNISYEEAYTKENLDKLLKKRDEFIKRR